MAIDKIYPKRLNLDDDVRMLEEGDMVNAENATLTKQKNNNVNGVISSAYGNSPVLGVGIDSGSIVIGSVSDSENQCIYFFTKGTAQAVYKYIYGGGIQKVFENDWLSFNDVNFVKADVVSGNFGQRQNPETILYFTDGKNPPRKINVDRAINGDFNGFTDEQLDLALNCIKGALTYPPTFRFEYDSEVNGNNLKTESFQFATQLIYKDGEESAISSYSALAASKYYFDQGTGDPTLFSSKQNVCVVNLNWATNSIKYKDVVKIRLLARTGNTGNFLVVDELPKGSPLYREVYGVRKQVWNHYSGSYRFYNSIIYDTVPEVTVNKLYDSVPFTATGQAIASNRLFFSDYTEFRPNGDDNGDPIRAGLTPVYVSSLSGSVEPDTDLFDYPSGQAQNDQGFIDVDLLQYDWAGNDDTTTISEIPANTNVYIYFKYSPTGANFNEDVISITLYDPTENSFQVGINPNVDFGSGLDVLYQIITSEATTVAALALQYAEFLSNVSYDVSFLVSGTSSIIGVVEAGGTSSNFTEGDPFNIRDVSITATIKFEIIDSNESDAKFIIAPYVSQIQLNSFSIPVSWNFDGTILSQGGVDYEGEWESYLIEPSDGYFDSVSNTSEYISSQIVVSDNGFYSSGFKWGCSHDLGVVYYDKYNRSGFVNKLGSFYVKHPAERTEEESRIFAGVQVSFSDLTVGGEWFSNAPSWAESFQIVYTGRNSYSDFLTYTTAGAYPERTSNNVVVENGKIYLSLKTLDKYQEEKSSLRSYSFTPGDKLRVISYEVYDGEVYVTKYAKANDGSIVEFDVVDVVTLTKGSNTDPSDDNPIIGTDTSGTNIEKYEGTFLVLDHPEITSGNTVTVDSNTVNLKYIGFDWHQITGTNYKNGDSATLTNYWGMNCIVEILTPRKFQGERPYYEIGERHPVVAPIEGRTGNHGLPITTFNGDIWWKKVSCKSAKGIGGSNQWNTGVPSQWTYFNNYIETASINDFKSSEDWSKGRAHYVFENAATYNRKNGITYSDSYEQDVANLSLSSFNPSLSNFSYIDRQFGPLNYIGNFNGNLVGIQDNKMSLIPIEGSIISYSEGQSGLAISTDVINKEQYASGDFGVSKKDLPSVLQKDNQLYFFDRSRNAILRYAGDQLTPITEKGVKNFFYQKFNNDLSSSVVSGYDPLIDSYFFTKKGIGSSGFTISYNVPLGVWQSFHSFNPDFYAYMNDTMFTFKRPASENVGKMMWSHGGTSSTLIYYGGNVSNFVVEVYSKINPSKVKTFNAISVESNVAFDANIISELNFNVSGENTFIDSTLFKKKEGIFYSDVYKKPDSSSLHYVGLCTEEAESNNYFITDKFLGRHAIPLQSSVYVLDEEGPFDSIQVLINSSGNTVTVSSFDGNNKISVASIFDDDQLLNKHVWVGGPNMSNGSHLRGRWMKIKLSSNSASHIYCINAHIAESKLTHTFNQ